MKAVILTLTLAALASAASANALDEERSNICRALLACVAKTKFPVCANCHESQWNAIDLSAHGAKNDANGSMCQTCHGDATEHLPPASWRRPSNDQLS